LRVTPIAGFSLGYREGAETNQGDPITFFEGSSNAVHGGVDGSTSLSFADVAGGRNPVNEIGFVHRLSLPGFAMPSAYGEHR
jgi:hypothetical protein